MLSSDPRVSTDLTHDGQALEHEIFQRSVELFADARHKGKCDRGSKQRVVTDGAPIASKAKQSETGQVRELNAQIDWVGQIEFCARDVQES